LRRTLCHAWITLQRVERQDGAEQALGARVHGSTNARTTEEADACEVRINAKIAVVSRTVDTEMD